MENLIKKLIDIGRWCWENKLVPATGGNFSVRLSPDKVAITRSGAHKGHLTEDDFIVVDLNTGLPDSKLKPSAETPLHLQLYRLRPEVGSVLHTHSKGATVLSRYYREHITISDFELLKALDGVCSPENELKIPIFPNIQDTEQLAQLIQDDLSNLLDSQSCWGYTLRGHGLYCWGKDPDDAFRHLEALEFMLDCQLSELLLTVR